LRCEEDRRFIGYSACKSRLVRTDTTSIEPDRCKPKVVQKAYRLPSIAGHVQRLTPCVVATYADVWNFVGRTLNKFRHKDVVKACPTGDRASPSIEKSVQFLAHLAGLPQLVKGRIRIATLPLY
jgi:hypothetical protein